MKDFLDNISIFNQITTKEQVLANNKDLSNLRSSQEVSIQLELKILKIKEDLSLNLEGK